MFTIFMRFRIDYPERRLISSKAWQNLSLHITSRLKSKETGYKVDPRLREIMHRRAAASGSLEAGLTQQPRKNLLDHLTN